MPFVPDKPEGSFVPDREGELATQAGPRGYTYAGQVKQPGEPKGFLKDVYEGVGGAAGLGAATGAYTMSKAPVDEEGGRMLPRWLAPMLGAGVGGAAGAAVEGKDMLPTGVASMAGEAGGNVLGNIAHRVVNHFEFGQYVGKIGKKISDIFGLPEIKTVQGLYDALHTGKAKEAMSKGYQSTVDEIFNAVGPDAKITGPQGQRLKEIFDKWIPPKLAAQGPNLLTGQNQYGGVPASSVLAPDVITLREAMENVRQLNARAMGGKGAAAHPVNEANAEARKIIADYLPSDLGTKYTQMNATYRQRMAVLNAYDPAKLFDTKSSGPQFNRPAWQRASNKALSRLQEVGAEDLDSIIRGGRKPGAVSSTMKIGGSGHLPWPFNFSRVYLPHKEIEYSPLRPAGDKINSVIDKVFKALGANVGAQAGEGTSEDQTGR